MTKDEVRRLVGAVMVMGFDGLSGSDHARTLIERHHVQNIILFSRNIDTREQTLALTSQLQEWAVGDGQDLRLLICTDQENGIVRRLGRTFPGFPGNMALGATRDPMRAREIGQITAAQLRAVGINMNLAPVLDVNNNPANPVIGVRSFGEDPQLVAAFGAEMVRGLQSGGVLACAKHFPGHGDTAVDSHVALPVIGHDRERLQSIEWVPFIRAIHEGIDAIMTAHVIFQAFDATQPATVSRTVLTGILREKLGFDGIITSDSMEMKAIADTIGIGSACVQALVAGADMIMVSHTLREQEEAIAAVCQAIENGQLPLQRVQDAAARIARKKRLRLKVPGVMDEALLARAAQVSADTCAQAVTIVRAEGLRLPLSDSAVGRIVILQDGSASVMMAADPSPESARATALAKEVGEVWPHAKIASYVITPPESVGHEHPQGAQYPTFAECIQADLVLVGLCGTRQPAYLSFVRELCSSAANVVVLALRSPYDLQAIPEAKTALALYEDTPWMMRAAVRALCAEVGPGGQLPVHLT